MALTSTEQTRLTNWIHAHTNDLVASLAELVRIPSVVGQEAAAQTWMAQRYAALGLDLDVFQPDKAALRRHPAFVDSEISFEGRPNVIGTLKGGGGGGRTLILNGHVDVVSAEPTGAWTRAPFGAVVESAAAAGPHAYTGTRMYGRGTMDMKAGVIANLFAVRALRECDIPLRGDLILQSVIEEEAGGGGGTLACFERGYRADGLIATEPHWIDVTIAHPGILYFRVTVEGRSAHAGRAHTGVNAAVETAPIIAMLGAWDLERAETLHVELLERPDPAARRSCHLNVGVVRAGDWPSTVPGRCVLEVRMSFIPGETEAGIRAEIERRVAAVAARSAWLRAHPPRVDYFGWHAEPWLQDERHPFVQDFLRVVRGSRASEFGDPLPLAMGNTSGLDTRFAAYYDMPALAFGPKGANLHGADEYVELDTVFETARLLALFAAEWCA
ncbi:MAG: ArgE/DapE family deacylase [Thermoflexales bacterium]